MQNRTTKKYQRKGLENFWDKDQQQKNVVWEVVRSEKRQYFQQKEYKSTSNPKFFNYMKERNPGKTKLKTGQSLHGVEIIVFFASIGRGNLNNVTYININLSKLELTGNYLTGDKQ